MALREPPVLAERDAVLDWAHGMVGPLRERAAETEQLRELHPDTVADAFAADLFKMVVPPELGGWGLGFRTLADTTRILAQGCMSSAWTLSFLVMHNWFIARGPAELHRQIFVDRPFALIPCPLAPTGTATPVDGGYTLAGRWQWATGVQHADWVMVNSIVDRDDGELDMRFCLLPIGDVDVDDVWHTSGMCGTGSNDVVVDGAFVPSSRTLTGEQLRADAPPGSELTSHSFVRYPFTPVLTHIAAAPALGGAEAAVEFFRDYVAGRVLPYSAGDRQVEQPASQVRLAEAIAMVRAARLVWDDAIDQVIERYEAGGILERAERGRFRLSAAHVVRLSLQAVDVILEGAGASVHFRDSALGRIHRDLVTLKGHVVFDWDRAAQLAGKLELGLDPLPTDML